MQPLPSSSSSNERLVRLTADSELVTDADEEVRGCSRIFFFRSRRPEEFRFFCSTRHYSVVLATPGPPKVTMDWDTSIHARTRCVSSLT